MPELPEVEVVRRGLAAHVAGRQVAGVDAGPLSRGVVNHQRREAFRRLHRWAEWNRRNKVELEDGVVAPDPNEEYLLYQTLVGAWPLSRDRAQAFAEKFVDENLT